MDITVMHRKWNRRQISNSISKQQVVASRSLRQDSQELTKEHIKTKENTGGNGNADLGKNEEGSRPCGVAGN